MLFTLLLLGLIGIATIVLILTMFIGFLKDIKMEKEYIMIGSHVIRKADIRALLLNEKGEFQVTVVYESGVIRLDFPTFESAETAWTSALEQMDVV